MPENKISGIWLLQRKERVCPASSRQIQGKDESKGQGTHQQKNGKRLRKVEGRPETVCGRWVNYYKLADMGAYLQSIDEWMRRRIRMVFWKKWKIVRTRWRNLLKLGISNRNAGILANSRKGYWRIASSPILQTALSSQRLRRLDSSSFILTTASL